jgi:hypothetical protein
MRLDFNPSTVRNKVIQISGKNAEARVSNTVKCFAEKGIESAVARDPEREAAGKTYYVLIGQKAFREVGNMCSALIERARSESKVQVQKTKLDWDNNIQIIRNVLTEQKNSRTVAVRPSTKMPAAAPVSESVITSAPKIEELVTSEQRAENQCIIPPKPEKASIPAQKTEEPAINASGKKPFYYLPYGLQVEIPGLDRTLESKTPIIPR